MDMVVRLLGEGQSYAGTMSAAHRGTTAVNNALDKLTAAMEAELAAEGRAAKQTEILSLADKGASAAKVEYALRLAGELESHRELEVAVAAEAAAKAKADALEAARQAKVDATVAALKQQNLALREGAQAAQAAELRLAGFTDEEVRAVQALQNENAMLKAKEAALAREIQAEKRAIQVEEELIATVTREAATYGMTSSELRAYTASQNGASAAAIKQAQAVEFATGAQMRFDRQIQKQIQSQRAAQQVMSASGKGHLAMIETTRGLEDAVQGFTNNGLKGMIQATSNNIGQIGAMIGGNAALYLGIGSVAALLGATLLPKLMEWADGTKSVRDQYLLLNDEAKKFHDEEMRRIDERYKAQFGRGREERRSQKLLGSGSAKDLMSEADRLRDQIEADKEAQIIERRKQGEILSNSPLAHLEKNPFARGSFHASPDEEVRKAQEENWKSARKEMVASRNAQLDAARDQDLHQRLLQKTEQAARDKAKQERKQEIDELVEEQREKSQKLHEQLTKQAEERAKKEHEFQAKLDAQNAALEAKAEDESRKKRADELTKEVGWKKKLIDQQAEGGGNDLTATEANSSEAFKRVFEATGRGGETNPNRIVADNTAKMLIQMRLDAELAEAELAAIKELKPFKTGPA